MWNSVWRLRLRFGGFRFTLPVPLFLLEELLVAAADLCALTPRGLPFREVPDVLRGVIDAMSDTGGLPLLDVEVEEFRIVFGPQSCCQTIDQGGND